MKSLLVNLRNICSRSQQGTGVGKKALETLSVFWLNNWRSAAVVLIQTANGALVTRRSKRNWILEPNNIFNSSSLYLLLLHASTTNCNCKSDLGGKRTIIKEIKSKNKFLAPLKARKTPFKYLKTLSYEKSWSNLTTLLSFYCNN